MIPQRVPTAAANYQLNSDTPGQLSTPPEVCGFPWSLPHITFDVTLIINVLLFYLIR